MSGTATTPKLGGSPRADPRPVTLMVAFPFLAASEIAPRPLTVLAAWYAAPAVVCFQHGLSPQRPPGGMPAARSGDSEKTQRAYDVSVSGARKSAGVRLEGSSRHFQDTVPPVFDATSFSVDRRRFAFRAASPNTLAHVPHPGRGRRRPRALRHALLRLRSARARGGGAHRARVSCALWLHAALRDEGQSQRRRPARVPGPRAASRRVERPRGRAGPSPRRPSRAHPAHLADAVQAPRGVRRARRALQRLLAPPARDVRPGVLRTRRHHS